VGLVISTKRQLNPAIWGQLGVSPPLLCYLKMPLKLNTLSFNRERWLGDLTAFAKSVLMVLDATDFRHRIIAEFFVL